MAGLGMDLNPDSEWKEVTCTGPFSDMPAEKISMFCNRRGEVTLDRPAEGVCSSIVDHNPEDFAKQYRRAARLQELRQQGAVSPAGPRHTLPAIGAPSEASQRLLDGLMDEQLLDPRGQTSRESFGAGRNGVCLSPHQLEPEPEPEPETTDEYQGHGRVTFLRGKVHHLGKNLWVGGIPDSELEGGIAGCERALHDAFSRFGTVEKVTVREKYNDPASHSPTGKQSWALLGFSDNSPNAVDRALATEVTLNGAELEVKEQIVKEHLSGRESTDSGKLSEKWVEFHTAVGETGYSQSLCCFRKSRKSGRWSWQCGGVREPKPLAGVSKQELRQAFELFDQDGNGAIDATELSSTMIALAKAGRMTTPTKAQLEQMMLEADEDGDGEIDFEEFCDLIANCDLHPSTCTRCEQSQYLLTEDFCFGEPRLEDPDAGRPETCRERMAARDEKMIHLSFAVVAAGAPLQTILLVLGATLRFGLDDRRTGSQTALIAGATFVVMAAFAITIGCASRPVIRGAFLMYSLWEITIIIAVIVAIDDVRNSTENCEMPPDNGQAAVPTSDACPMLVVNSSTIGEAKAMCVGSATEGFCEWSDKCSLQTVKGCAATLPLGICVLTEDDECTVGDASTAFGEDEVLDLWGNCGPATACRYHRSLEMIGWLACSLAGVTLVAIANILYDSQFRLGLQLNTRRQQSMWTLAMQMSLDPTMHSAKDIGNLSHRYGVNQLGAQTTLEGAILGSALSGSNANSAISRGPDGTVKVKSSGLGV